MKKGGMNRMGSTRFDGDGNTRDHEKRCPKDKKAPNDLPFPYAYALTFNFLMIFRFSQPMLLLCEMKIPAMLVVVGVRSGLAFLPERLRTKNRC